MRRLGGQYSQNRFRGHRRHRQRAVPGFPCDAHYNAGLVYRGISAFLTFLHSAHRGTGAVCYTGVFFWWLRLGIVTSVAYPTGWRIHNVMLYVTGIGYGNGDNVCDFVTVRLGIFGAGVSDHARRFIAAPSDARYLSGIGYCGSISDHTCYVITEHYSIFGTGVVCNAW